MPAYMVPLAHLCAAADCSKMATHRVRNTWNAELGLFCQRHADLLVAELNADGRGPGR